MRPVILLENVTVAYNGEPALMKISFKVEEPSFLVVAGPNGAGKTTLLKTLLGLLKPIEGKIVVLGINVLKNPLRVRKLVGYVPQRERIDPSMPMLVKDVVLMGRTTKTGLGRLFTKEDIEAAKKALELVGLEEHWDEAFSHLSGGQQQRVLIARALASNPKLLLLDEPLSGVDALSQNVILGVLREMADRGTGVVMVTHDLNPILELADYILLLNKRVVGFGRPNKILSREVLSEAYNRSCLLYTSPSPRDRG